MSASSTSSLLLLLVLLALTESRPSHPRDNAQALEQLFGSHLSSLIQAPPPSKVTEGSADSPAPFAPHAVGGLAGRRAGAGPGAVPRYFLDFLQRQRKFRGRSRKSTLRGCFGMKVDRIGSASGLGC